MVLSAEVCVYSKSKLSYCVDFLYVHGAGQGVNCRSRVVFVKPKEVEVTTTSASSVPGRFPVVNSVFVNHRFVLRITL